MVPTKFKVSWPFGSGGEAKNRFSRWRPLRQFRFFDRNNYSYFLIYSSPRCFLLKFMSIGLLAQEEKRKKKKDFHSGSHGDHFSFTIGTILVFFFIYKSPRCFLPNFKSIGLLIQKEKRKIEDF